MQTKRLTFLTACLLSAAMLWGCGSNGSGGSDVQTIDPSDVQTLGTRNCIFCHSTEGFGDGEVWMATLDSTESKGMNKRSNAHGNIDGSPSLGAPDSCQVCHNPAGDGQNLMADFGASSNRPVVGCEGCHGGGSAHRGLGPLPTPRPTLADCARCHNEHGNNIDNLADDFAQSMHANTMQLSPGGGNRNCMRCHNHEAALAFGDHRTGGYGTIPADIPSPATRSAFSCATCHDEHFWGFRTPADWALGSAQYNLCTSCHNLTRKDGSWYGVAGTEDHAVTLQHSATLGPAGRLYDNRVIADTHFDNPATLGHGDMGVIEGYVVKTNSKSACADCHNVHSGDLTIQIEWANSAHGGYVAQAKNDTSSGTIYTRGVTKASAPGWAYYDWDASNRASCQRCHTATGAMNFLDDPDNYDAANNDFSHLAGWSKAVDGTVTPSQQNEMLYCWGCHDNATTGSMRDPGALEFTYTNNAVAAYPDASSSNVCISCHTGRETGDSIKNDPSDTGIRNFINSHYLAAGGMVFATSGYEYDGRNYAYGNDDHHKIGMLNNPADFVRSFPNAADFTSGPCVACHFSSDNGSHLLSPFTFVAATGNTALNPMCVSCHPNRGPGGSAEDSANTWYGKDFKVEDLVAGVAAADIPHKGRMLASLEALRVQLEDLGIYFYEAHPYFFTAPYVVGGTNTGFTNWDSVATNLGVGLDVDPTGTGWRNVMGAAFNYNLIAHDPAATAHNRRYARRLIYDSIDFLDDGLMNDSVNATLNALPDTADYKLGALGYLASRP